MKNLKKMPNHGAFNLVPENLLLSNGTNIYEFILNCIITI